MFDRNDPRHRLIAALAASSLIHVLVVGLPLAHSRMHPSIRIATRLEATLTGGQTVARTLPPEPANDADTWTGAPAAPSVGLPLPLPDEVYLPASALSQLPDARDNPSAEALSEVLDLAKRGVVDLAIWIDHKGNVSKIDVERSTLSSQATDTIVAAFLGVRYTPGERDGQPVAAVIRMEVTVN